MKFSVKRACLSAVALQAACLPAVYAEKPNVIVIFTDDHGYPDIKIQGYLDDLKTPNIDSLANGGVRVTDGYVTAPQCVPSRGGLVSGIYQNRFGLESNGNFGNPEFKKRFAELKTLPERLKEAGYATGMAGKWHLGPDEEIHTHGFDKVYERARTNVGYGNFDLKGQDKKSGRIKDGLYHLDACSAAATAFIEVHKDQPFLFYLAYRAPHTPLDAPKKYTDRFPKEMPERRRQALAMISAMDDGVGEILKTLRKHDLEEKTLIFLIGDNGAPLKIDMKDHPLSKKGGWDGSYNAPLNGEKGTLMDGGIRTPFLLYWKGTLPAGEVYRHPLISLDVAATAVEIAGLPKANDLDGVNVIPYLTGKVTTPPHEHLYWRWRGQSAIRSGKWKLVYGDKKGYLFDMEADKAEKTNLIEDHPDIAARLLATHNAWATHIGLPKAEELDLPGPGRMYFTWYFHGKRIRPSSVRGEDALPEAGEADDTPRKKGVDRPRRKRDRDRRGQ